MKLCELYFGDLEAFDEANNEREFFRSTFVAPLSMSVASLKNNRQFIVVGRKGAGKTAVQMHFAEELHQTGYFTSFFRFSEDLRSDDYREISKTQSHISLASVTNERQLFLNYDFRDVWERVFFNKVAEQIFNAGHSNKFTQFVHPKSNTLHNVFAGISKTLTITLSAEMCGIATEVGIDLSKLAKPSELPLKDFNQVTRKLFAEHCAQFRMYFFVDELVFSKLDAKDDEIRLRAAMVRDIIKCCRELNNYCSQNDMDFHFICSLRPEIRNMINDLDSEIGKVVDGKDVLLSWYIDDDSGTTLIEQVLNLKIRHSATSFRTKLIDPTVFLTRNITFGKECVSIGDFLKTNSWGRPRDVVRLLLAAAKMNPNSTKIGEDEIKSALDEYSRASAKELVDEISVFHGKEILRALRNGIRKKTYNSIDDFLRALPLSNINEERLATELFELGLIGGYQPETGNYYWAHRGQNFLPPQMKVRVHPALWNEFNIRGYR